ncbi:MAG: hypothetical protein ACXAC7_01925, partial [Candidatus Hodarchaeales archaeon]
TDGSWGRLHSQDTSVKQKIITTEWGVEKAISLGLDAQHPILIKALDYLTNIIDSGACRDPPEKNDRWTTGVRLFIASTISKILPNHPTIEGVRQLWEKIVYRTFSDGKYNQNAERFAHRELTGIKSDLRYLTLNSVYHVSLIGSNAENLKPDFVEAYLNWIWNEIGYIRYRNVSLKTPPNQLPKKQLIHWLNSIELLSVFPSWTKYAKDSIDWMWEIRTKSGLWKFNYLNPFFRYSKEKRKFNLQHEWSTRILKLLNKYLEDNKVI